MTCDSAEALCEFRGEEFRVFIGKMEKRMETTIVCPGLGYVGLLVLS